MLLSVLLAATLECPHWISIMPLVADDAEAIATDAASQGNETLIDGIAWSMSIHPTGNPAKDLASQYAATYRKLQPLVRARSNVRQGILVQSTMGHGGFPSEATKWQLTVKENGTSVYRMCPLGAPFLDYVAKSCRILAALKPDFVMIDDDTRICWADTPGCFCPLHLAKLAEATGRTWTREEAAAKVAARDAEFLKTWEAIKFDSMAAFFKTIRASFPAEMPMILCVVGNPWHFKHARTFAQMLAAPGQVPVVRGSGANYCGNNIYHCLYSRAGFARQLEDIGKDVVYLQEADTCPQTLWSCSATREYESMVLQALEGVKGAKIWITRLGMTRERRSQEAYRRIFRENRGIMTWAAKTDFRPCGVVVPNVGVGNDVEEWPGFGERYFALMGIPYRYGKAGKNEVTALCADTLKRLSRTEIEEVLSGAALLDATAANWLSENGFSDLIGVDAKRWKLRTIQKHLDENGYELGGMRVEEDFADLTALRTGAMILSRLYNTSSTEPTFVSAGAIRYANARGGRVITMALPLRSAMPCYWQHTMLSETYRAWVVRLLEQLGQRFPVRVDSAGPILCEAGTSTADGNILVINPLDLDDLVDPEVVFATPPTTIEQLAGDGSWRKVSCDQRLHTTIRAKHPTIFRYR